MVYDGRLQLPNHDTTATTSTLVVRLHNKQLRTVSRPGHKYWLRLDVLIQELKYLSTDHQACPMACGQIRPAYTTTVLYLQLINGAHERQLWLSAKWNSEVCLKLTVLQATC